MKKTLLTFFAAAAVCACTYPFTPVLPDAEDRPLVVEGNLLIGEQSPIRLSVVKPLSEDSVAPSKDDGILSAKITVEDNAGINYPVTGSYLGGFTARMESAVPGREYRMTIYLTLPKTEQERASEEDDPVEVEVYQTPWLKVHTAPFIGDIRFTAEEDYVQVQATMTPSESDNPYYFWEFDENWEEHAQYNPGYFFDLETEDYYQQDGWVNPNYYCWYKASSREPGLYSAERLSANRMERQVIRSIHRTDTRFQVLYAILVRTRGISPEGYKYYGTVGRNSNLTGDLFSAMPDKVSGNIQCISDPSRSAIGFIEAVTTASKRIFIDSRYYREALPDQREVPELNVEYTLTDHYKSGYRPLYPGIDRNKVSGMLWCPLACIDCVVNGGTKDKPDFWPNDHQ